MLDETIAVCELRHRVANDLHIIGELVELARRARPEDAYSALTAIAERLAIIGSVHRALRPASIETRFSNQLSVLCSQGETAESGGRRVRISLLTEMMLRRDQAISETDRGSF